MPLFVSLAVCLGALSPFSFPLAPPWVCPLVGLCYSPLGLGAGSREKNMYAISVNLSFTYDCLSVILSSLSSSVCVRVRVCDMCTTWQYHLSIN